jgi:DNA-binding NarL/FixJ family response regulator
MDPIRVIIAEDQKILRQTYLLTLEDAEHITVLDAVDNGADAVKLVQKHQPDVVLLDIQMPKLNGIKAAEQIRELFPKTGIVILSHYNQRQYAETFLRNGTSGKAYLLKTRLNDPSELIRAIEVVYEGGAILAPEIQDQLIQLATATPNSKFNSLTKREMEVLGCMAEGYTNISIANRLHISERTVESHVNNIFGKLGLTSEANRNPRVMAVLLFFEAGDV